MKSLLACLAIYWISVSGQKADYDYDDATPITELKQLKLKKNICGTLECLRRLTDLFEVDEVIFNTVPAHRLIGSLWDKSRVITITE